VGLVSWNAAQRTIAARLEAVTTLLPALLVATGLPPIATDASTDSGLAVYDSPRISYASPCVEIMPVEGPLVRKGSTTLTDISGYVSLSFQTTDPAEMAALAAGYLTVLVAVFAPSLAAPNELWEVNFATMSATAKQGDSLFVQGVSVRVAHQLAEPV
jgi:uncharacterized membrane protein